MWFVASNPFAARHKGGLVNHSFDLAAHLRTIDVARCERHPKVEVDVSKALRSDLISEIEKERHRIDRGDVVFAIGALLMAWDFVAKTGPLFPLLARRLQLPDLQPSEQAAE